MKDQAPKTRPKKGLSDEAKLLEPSVPKEDTSSLRRERQRHSLGILSSELQQAAAKYRLSRIEEFAKTLPYSLADARAEHPDVDEAMLVKLWVGQRWLLAQAMVDLQPDLSIKFEESV